MACMTKPNKEQRHTMQTRSTRALGRALLASILALFVLACSGGRDEPVSDHKDDSAADPITDAEAEAFGEAIASALAPCDPKELERLVDTAAAIQLAMKGLSPTTRQKMKEDFEAIDHAQQFCSKIPGVTARFLSVQRREHVSVVERILYRNRVDYHEYYLRRDGERIRAFDYLIFTGGQTWSAGIHDLYKHARDRAFDVAVLDVRRLRRAREFKRAREVIAALPAYLRTGRFMMHYDLQLAALTREAGVYERAFERYRRAYPDDSSPDIDLFYVRMEQEDFEGAQAPLERLRSRVGDDPFLEFFAGFILLKQEKYAQAEPKLESVVRREPSLKDPHWHLVQVYNAQEKFEAAAERLTVIRQTFEADLSSSELADDPRYSTFFASDAGKAWAAANQ